MSAFHEKQVIEPNSLIYCAIVWKSLGHQCKLYLERSSVQLIPESESLTFTCDVTWCLSLHPADIGG